MSVSRKKEAIIVILIALILGIIRWILQTDNAETTTTTNKSKPVLISKYHDTTINNHRIIQTEYDNETEPNVYVYVLQNEDGTEDVWGIYECGDCHSKLDEEELHGQYTRLTCPNCKVTNVLMLNVY